MRKFFTVCLFSFVSLTAVPSVGQAQCLFCMAFGYAIGSSGSRVKMQEASGVNPVLYTVPRIAERVKNPLDVMMESTDGTYPNGETLQQKFYHVVRNADQYVILEVLRFFGPEHPSRIILVFTYTERRNVIPIEKLPPEKKPDK